MTVILLHFSLKNNLFTLPTFKICNTFFHFFAYFTWVYDLNWLFYLMINKTFFLWNWCACTCDDWPQLSRQLDIFFFLSVPTNGSNWSWESPGPTRVNLAFRPLHWFLWILRGWGHGYSRTLHQCTGPSCYWRDFELRQSQVVHFQWSIVQR